MNAYTQSRPSWWSCNWKWFVPTFAVLLLSLAISLIALIVWGIASAMKSSDAYKLAVNHVLADPRVIEQLGEPIEPGWFASGNVSINGPNGDASLSIPLKGSHDSGTLYVEAKKSVGQWQFETLIVRPENTSHPSIDLLTEETSHPSIDIYPSPQLQIQ